MPTRVAIALLVILVGPAGFLASQPSDEAVAKLITQLGSADFRVRDQAGLDLAKLGDPALARLRTAALTNVPLETKRRIEGLVERIEEDLLTEESKNWQTLDAPYYVKDHLARIMRRKPPMSDEQSVAAAYLLILNRRPTDAETSLALARFKESNYRTIPILRIARPLLRAKGADVDLIYSYARVDKALDNPRNAEQLGMISHHEAILRFGAALTKTARTDAHLADLTYLLVLARFPEPHETRGIAGTLKRGHDRAREMSYIVHALQKTDEFKLIR